jgi:hypothetical protein
MTHDKSPATTLSRQLPDILRKPRALALLALAAAVPIATLVAFVLSYRGLVDYALSVGVPGWLAWAYPLMFDLPIIGGEAVLFVAAVDHVTRRRSGGFWRWLVTTGRVTGWAWAVTIGFAVLSAAGNAGLLPAVAARALPPIVLAILLGFGLGEVKRHTAPPKADRPQPARAMSPPPSTAVSTAGGRRGRALDEVAERRAADKARELVAMDAWPGEREFARSDECGGNRHMARRAYAAATQSSTS